MSIHIEIAVPEKSVFSASDATMVIVPGADGQLTICLLYTSDAADE